jgi:hypothetical protein
LGVRWNTVSRLACRAIMGITWMPEEPVPITPTRWPVKSTGCLGQLPVWYQRPPKDSRPGSSGTREADRQPAAEITNRALTRSPRSVATCQRPPASSKTALVTRVSSWSIGHRSNRSATWLM